MTEEVLFTALRWAERAGTQARDWYQRNLVPMVPPTNKLAYVFRPATADLVSMSLIVLALLPVWGGSMSWMSCLLLLVLACHVVAAWLAHTVNLVKLKTFEKLASPFVAQQQLLKSKEASLQQLLQGNAQLQSSIQQLEAATADLPALKARHDMLQAKAQQVERLQQQVEAGQKQLLHLPKLYTQLRHLQARRRTMEKVKWAVQVLKAETARADKYSKEYAQLKAARSTSQASKSTTAAAAQSNPKQTGRPASAGSPLRAKDMNVVMPAASGTSPTAKAKVPTRSGETRRSVESLTLYTARQSMATTPCSGASKPLSTTSKPSAAVAVKPATGTLSGYRLKGAMPADSGTGSVGSVTAATEPSFRLPLPTQSNSTGSVTRQNSKPAHLPEQPASSGSSSHARSATLKPATTTHSDGSQRSVSLAPAPRQAQMISPRGSVGSVAMGGVGGAAAKQAQVLSPRGSVGSVVVVGVNGTTNSERAAAHGQAAVPPLTRLEDTSTRSQDTPSNSSHAKHRWTTVVDNEAFFTPALPHPNTSQDVISTPMSDAAFTPGPEAAAFAAALSAGLVPWSRPTGAAATQSQCSGAQQPSMSLKAARLSYGTEAERAEVGLHGAKTASVAAVEADMLMDDASYPPTHNQAPAASAPMMWQAAAQQPNSMTVSAGSYSLR